ncbi:topoisomerase DNA-binding C4 zinc finger domain-containing protein [Suttonella ornithocola]
MEVAYTRNMEDSLDAIAQGRADYAQSVGQYDRLLDEQLETFEADNSITAMSSNEPTYPCPECGQGQHGKSYKCGACGGILKLRQGKKGKFWGCSNYPDCKHTEQDVNGIPQFHQNTH